MRALVIAVAFSACALAQAYAAAQTAEPPDWIAGNWLRCENGVRVSETWSGAGTGILVGHGLTHGPRGVAFEFLRIARDGDANAYVYVASPGGGASTAFTLVSSGPDSAVFENPAHDFPQRIAYERKGDTLTARIELIDGGNTMSWTYNSAPLGADCTAAKP